MADKNDGSIILDDSIESRDDVETNKDEPMVCTPDSGNLSDDDERLIEFFEKEKYDTATKTSYVGTFNQSDVSRDEIDAAYQMLVCKKTLCYDTLKRRKKTDEEADHVKKNSYKPSPCDIIVSREGQKHRMNFVQNSVVKQCSLYAFEELCISMADILTDMTKINNITPKLFRKFKQDIILASRLLQSTQNISHGMFLGDGGAYSKRLYQRKLIEFNAKNNLVKTRPTSMDAVTARKEINFFLSEVDDAQPKVPINPKPKRLTQEDKKQKEVGKAVFLKDNKIRIVFSKGDSMIINGPLTNSIYSPEEIFCVLKEQVDTKIHNKVMKVLSDDCGCGLVPISYEGLRKAFYRYRRYNIYNDCWMNKGRKPIATEKEIEAFKDDIFRIEASTMSEAQIEMFLNKNKRKQAAEKNNFSPAPVARSTLGHYKSYISADYNIIQKRFVKYKDEIRYASETSLRMVCSYIFSVAVSHLLPGKPCLSHPAHSKFGTEGSKLLAKFVCQAEGVDHVYPINPAFVTSTDDTVIYITDIEQENDAASIRFALRDTDHNCRNMKSKNYFVTSKKVHKLGIRVKLTCTFAANGNCASQYIIISGLKEADMPSQMYPNGYHVECIEGLSAAAAVDPGVKTPGYIVFVRSGRNTSEDQEDDIGDDGNESDDDDECIDLGTGMRNNVKYYGETVLLEFIKSQRENCSYNNAENDQDDQTSKAWFDGDINQVKVFSSPEFLAKGDILNVEFNKQNAARSTSEQGADMGEMFKNYKSNTQRRKLLDLPHSHIFGKVKKLFDNLASTQKINIPSRKRKLLTSFIADLPQISLISCPRRAVITAFIRNGMIDEENHLWPDVNRMIDTLGYQLTDEQFHLVFDNFKVLYEAMRDTGYISEELFEKLGFPLDTTSKGEVVHRNYGVSQEWCQRAKILSSPYQRNLRKERFQTLRDKIEKKERDEKDKIRKKLEINRIAEEKIICKMKTIQEMMNKRRRTNEIGNDSTNVHEDGNSDETCDESDRVLSDGDSDDESDNNIAINSIGDCKIEAFDAPLAKELKEFIHVRKYSTLRASNDSHEGWTWPNKKTVEAAVRGERCLILLAYGLCGSPVLLKEP